MRFPSLAPRALLVIHIKLPITNGTEMGGGRLISLFECSLPHVCVLLWACCQGKARAFSKKDAAWHWCGNAAQVLKHSVTVIYNFCIFSMSMQVLLKTCGIVWMAGLWAWCCWRRSQEEEVGIWWRRGGCPTGALVVLELYRLLSLPQCVAHVVFYHWSLFLRASCTSIIVH